MEQSVRDLIANRVKEASGLCDHKDNRHCALVLEGGGMRGVISIGFATGLAQSGAGSCFDSIHGASAGAFAGAYFAANQCERGGSIYFEDINNSIFINLWRALLGRPIMDLDFLVSDVMTKKKVLDTHAIVEHEGYLNVVLTELDSAKSKVVSKFGNAESVRQCLKASAFLPLIAGHHAEFEGASYLDGGVSQHIALQSAVNRGATHILLVMTRRMGAFWRREKSIGRLFELTMMRLAYGDKLASEYAVRAQKINLLLREVVEKGSYQGVPVEVLAPSVESAEVSRLTKSGELLRKAFDESVISGVEYVMGNIDK